MQYGRRSNPFLSRKTYNQTCEWWSRDTFDGQLSLSKMAVTRAPSGSFRAKAISQFMMDNRVEGDIRLMNGYVTIETPDDVSFMRPNCIVKFEGLFYRVENISRREISKTREFMKQPLCVFVLQLTR